MSPANQPDVLVSIRDFLTAASGQSSFSDTDDLMRLGVLDSLQIMELISYLEQEFAIEVGPEHITTENVRTIETIAALVDRLR